MNSVARISNLLRHRDERSALCVESHNCKSISHCPSVITGKLTLAHPLVKSEVSTAIKIITAVF